MTLKEEFEDAVHKIAFDILDKKGLTLDEKIIVRNNLVKWSGYKEEHPFIQEFKDEDGVEMFNSTHELIKNFIFKTRNEVVLANAIYLNMNEINGDKEFIQMFKFTCRLIGLNSEWS